MVNDQVKDCSESDLYEIESSIIANIQAKGCGDHDLFTG